MAGELLAEVSDPDERGWENSIFERFTESADIAIAGLEKARGSVAA